MLKRSKKKKPLFKSAGDTFIAYTHRLGKQTKNTNQSIYNTLSFQNVSIHIYSQISISIGRWQVNTVFNKAKNIIFEFNN